MPLRRGGAFPFRRKTLVSDPYLKACGTTGPTGCGSQKNTPGASLEAAECLFVVCDCVRVPVLAAERRSRCLIVIFYIGCESDLCRHTIELY